MNLNFDPYPMDYEVFVDSKPKGALKQMRQEQAKMHRSSLSEPFRSCAHLYFFVKGNHLKCLCPHCDINCEQTHPFPKQNLAKIEEVFPGFISSGQNSPPLSTIYTYLYYQEFTDYYKALMQFKWESNLLKFPLFDLRESIRVVDGRLVALQQNKYGCYTLLTDDLVTKAVEQFGGHANARFELKRRIARELLKNHSEENISEKNSQNIEIETPQFSISYIPTHNQAVVQCRDGFIFRRPHLTESGTTCLRTLVGADTQQLDNIATLIAGLYMPERPSNYLWVVTGSYRSVTNFMRWLWSLCGGRVSSTAYAKLDKEQLVHLVEEQLNGCGFQYNAEFLTPESFNKIKHTFLKKYVAGEQIGTIDDPFIINGDVHGKGILIYAAPEFGESSLKDVPHKVIRVPDGWDWDYQQPGSDDRWIQTCFACHGLRLLNMRVSSKNSTLNLDEAIRKFISEFCTIKERARTDRKHFYEQFKKYCDACLSLNEEIPGSTKFSHRIEEITTWKSEAVRNNKNRLAYIDIALDEERITAAISDDLQRKATRYSQNTSAGFDAYIKQIDDSFECIDGNHRL